MRILMDCALKRKRRIFVSVPLRGNVSPGLFPFFWKQKLWRCVVLFGASTYFGILIKISSAFQPGPIFRFGSGVRTPNQKPNFSFFDSVFCTEISQQSGENLQLTTKVHDFSARVWRQQKVDKFKCYLRFLVGSSRSLPVFVIYLGAIKKICVIICPSSIL